MRLPILAALLATVALALPARADDPTKMVTLKPDQIAQIFCLSRTGNDEGAIEGLLSDGLKAAIAEADKKDAAWQKAHPGEKPPLGDGTPWQSSPDYAPQCAVGLATLSKQDAKVEVKYSFPDDAAADFTDTLILKKIALPDYGVGIWRIDNVAYGDSNEDLKGELVSAFAN